MKELLWKKRAVGQIPLELWPIHQATQLVIAALTAEGTTVRFVGGYIRDTLLRRHVQDIDIATPDKPEHVMRLLRRAGINVLPTGISHGTVMAIVDGRSFEITTLRRDISCNGRRAVVAYTDDWVEDAARRDFTINTLSADPYGTVYDPFNGLLDLCHGRVRFVGSPHARIEEDILRLLRYFRFYAWYGSNLPPDSDALAACHTLAPRLALLSAERIRSELWKILLAPDPARVLLLMKKEQVLPYVLPEAGNFDHLRLLAKFEECSSCIKGIVPDPLRRLVAVLTVGKVAAKAMARRLRLSNYETYRLLGLLEIPPELAPMPDMAEHALRYALQSLGAERFRDITLLQWAQQIVKGHVALADDSMLWIRLLVLATTWKAIPFPVCGKDVLALGLRPGPNVGILLNSLRLWWEQTAYKADRSALLLRLAELAIEYGMGEV